MNQLNSQSNCLTDILFCSHKRGEESGPRGGAQFVQSSTGNSTIERSTVRSVSHGETHCSNVYKKPSHVKVSVCLIVYSSQTFKGRLIPRKMFYHPLHILNMCSVSRCKRQSRKKTPRTNCCYFPKVCAILQYFIF